jgi:ABC-type uncharacterized transport system substrate-binding protein
VKTGIRQRTTGNRHLRAFGWFFFGLLTVPCFATAEAQQSARLPRIGILELASPTASASQLKALQRGLRELGYVEGKNVIYEYRYADGKIERLPELAAELVGSKVDVIVTIGSARVDSRAREADPAAKALGIQLHSLELKSADDFARVFAIADQIGVQALSLAPSPLLFTHRSVIFDFVAKHRLPAMYSTKDFVEAGGLMSYGQDIIDNWRRAATFVDKILKGAKPGNLPVEQATKFELVINAKSAKQIGLTIPPNVLARADRVIK